MISYLEAIQILEANAKATKVTTQTVCIQNAVGRVCAQDVRAAIEVQPFDNSAMDGYAVQAALLDGATLDTPIRLACTQTIGAGMQDNIQRPDGNACVAIMTGAPMPKWADSVVQIEHTSKDDTGHVVFRAPVSCGQHVRMKGEDFSIGDMVAGKGTVLTHAHVMALAALGIGEIACFKKPRVCFLATGDEIVGAESGICLQHGQIYDSNTPYVSCILTAMGCTCSYALRVKDTENEFSATLCAMLEDGADIVLSTGGVSAGQFDFVPCVLKKLGAEILFHKVAIKPGKPILFARFPNGTFYFGLPGNPASTAVGLRFFVQPFLDALFGSADRKPVRALLTNPVKKNNALRTFLKAYISANEDGQLYANILDGQESFMISPFLKMNAWACIEEGTQELKAGDFIHLHLL